MKDSVKASKVKKEESEESEDWEEEEEVVGFLSSTFPPF